MMDAVKLALLIQSAVLLAGLLVILFWVWSAVRLDCFRQNMFAIRDELFDYAASGRIAFNHPAYRLLRQSMNGFIRYGHQISFGQFIVTWLTWKTLEGRESFQWTVQWEAALASLSEETRNDLKYFHERASLCVTERIVFGSPILVLLLGASILGIAFHASWKSAKSLLEAALSDTASRAIDQRILEEEAARAAAAA